MHMSSPLLVRFLVALPLVLSANVGSIGCASPVSLARSKQDEGPASQLGNVGEKLTSVCRLETVGLPCDPDGDGSATECEGLCWVDDAAEVSCLALAAVNLVETDLNGRICGDELGRDCSRSCENGECVEKNARLGTACRPGPNSTSCDGVCTLADGEPVCDEVSVCDEVAISEDGCVLTACNFESFEQGCTTVELSNPVCEASQVEPDVDASAELPDAGTDSDAGSQPTERSDASVTSADEPTSVVRDAGVTTSTTTGVGSTSSGDAGSVVDGGTPSRTPVRVVGGACSVVSPTQSELGGVGLLALLGSLVARRRRAVNSRARRSALR